jgi:hypothetical protein
VFFATLSLAGEARADDPETSPPAPKTFRVDASLTAGYASLHRDVSSPQHVGAVVLGGELRLHPFEPHGAVLAYTRADGIFGPHVDMVDVAYSYRFIGAERLHGVTGAAYVDLGPAIGFVSQMSPSHTVIGGRVSVAFDAHLGFFTLGTVLGYRGGVPISGPPDGWEGALTWLVRAGFVFDVARR